MHDVPNVCKTRAFDYFADRVCGLAAQKADWKASLWMRAARRLKCWEKKHVGGQSYLEKRPCSCAFAPTIKVETFPIKRPRVPKEISLWSGHVAINLALPYRLHAKNCQIKHFTRTRRVA